MELGFNIWGTATVYGMGSSEVIIGGFIGDYKRENLVITTIFTPQIANVSNSSVADMLR